MKDADGIVGGLDGDAAGCADGHELHGLGAPEEKVRLPVGAGGHIPGRKPHTGSCGTSGNQTQAKRRELPGGYKLVSGFHAAVHLPVRRASSLKPTIPMSYPHGHTFGKLTVVSSLKAFRQALRNLPPLYFHGRSTYFKR
jgi:hypothetical protein